MLTFLLIIPLLGVLGILLTESEGTIQKQIALGASLVNFVLSLVLWGKFDSSYNGFQFVHEFDFISFCHFNIGVDGISLFFVLLTTFTIPICILASWDNIQVGVKKFLMNFLILETILIAVFVVLDLLLFYISFESTLIPMFLIIGIWGSRERKIHAAYFFFLITLLGSLFMLLGILAIYFQIGTTDYQMLTTMDLSLSRQRILWLAFFLSFAVKTPLVPVHIWLPYAHTEAPVAGSIVLAGVLLKLAGYGILRVIVGMLPEGSNYFTPLIFAICAISVIYSSLTTIRQIDLKSIVAYSSIGHISIVTLGIFSNTFQGIEGSILLIIAHGLVSPALFICVGVLYDRYHTRVFKYYRGITQYMPVFVLFFFVFTLANMATPLTINFIGEFLSFTGAFMRNPVFTCLCALSIILSAAYSIWIFNRVCFGSFSIYLKPISDLTRREFMLLLPLLFLTLLFGIFPNLLLDVMHVSVSNLLMHSPLSPFSTTLCECTDLLIIPDYLPSTVCKGHLTKVVAAMVYLTPLAKGIVVGLILGDAYLSTSSKMSKNARLVFVQSTKHFSYFWSVYSRLWHYCPSLPYLYTNLRKGVINYSTRFQTRSFPCFTQLYTIFYVDGVKIIPEDIFNLLTPIALAHWIMNDGCWERSGVILCTDSFSIQEMVRLISVLTYKYQLDCSLREYRPNQYRIYIKANSVKQLRSIVLPHMHPSMLYKINIKQ
jgi:NADH-ubiquinone oxidoreductase chain 4